MCHDLYSTTEVIVANLKRQLYIVLLTVVCIFISSYYQSKADWMAEILSTTCPTTNLLFAIPGSISTSWSINGFIPNNDHRLLQ